VAQCPVRRLPDPVYAGLAAYVVQGGDCEPDSLMVVSEAAIRLRVGYEVREVSWASESLEV
jgi:hypothetical protein